MARNVHRLRRRIEERTKDHVIDLIRANAGLRERCLSGSHRQIGRRNVFQVFPLAPKAVRLPDKKTRVS